MTQPLKGHIDHSHVGYLKYLFRTVFPICDVGTGWFNILKSYSETVKVARTYETK